MTEYVPVKSSDTATLLKVTLITGRSHQIRAHLASIGHPILGDFKYGDPKVNEQIQKKYKVRSQLLHSWKLVNAGKNGAAFRLSGRKRVYCPFAGGL